MRRIWALSGLVLLSLSSCQQFFTTSLVKVLARPAQTISELDAAGASAFVASLAQNPDQATAAGAMDALAVLVKEHPTPAVLKDASQVAVMATGLDSALTQAMTSVDLAALTSGTAPTKTEMATIASIITTAGQNVTPASAAIFTALAASAKSDPAALAASGVGAETLVMAAAAVAINDISNNLAPGQTLAQVLDGSIPAPTMSAATQTDLANLTSGAQAIDPNNALLATLQSTLNIKF